ncbi:AAA family ATPase [Arsenophonus sp.]|uniref:AAA family ATPase n=1 Tax=Arsenophonus sp. TaxID=1872640 RepID=UPI002857320D|nr:AAA family ATPase [Arsenophonus sp.]MDR5616333.1 AAA family ATPase [Arsenophonus sp.]
MSSNLKQIINNLSLQARECLDSAASLAVSHTHHEIENEHLLLMLLEKQTHLVEQLCYHANGDALKLLEACQASLAQLRGGCHRSPVFSIMLTDWLESAWMYATIRWQMDKLSPLLLLATLLAERKLHQGLPLYLQQALQINGEQLDKAVEIMMQQQSVAASEPKGQASALMKYAHHLTQAARENKLDPVLGREKEIRQLIDILLRRRQNNPLLTGEAGVGKTALVEGLAQRIVAGNIPAALAKVELFTLDLGLLQAGASVKGEFENRLQQLLDEVKNYPLPIILFIDEAHTLIGAGGQAGQNDAANLLKPALARGELRTIAATTQAEYKKYFEKDAALARRFQLIKVDETSQEVAIAMLRAMVPMMEQHHGVRILDGAVTEAVRLAARYITGRQLPDKSVTLLDSACARVAISQCGEPGPIEDLRAMLAQRNVERQSLLREGNSEHENVSRQIEQLQTSLNLLLPEYHEQQRLVQVINAAGDNETAITPLRSELQARHQQHAYVFDCVDAACVADIVSGWTGIPITGNYRNAPKNFQQLRHRKVVVVSGHILLSEFEHEPDIELIEVDNMDKAIEMVLAGAADTVLDNFVSANYLQAVMVIAF